MKKLLKILLTVLLVIVLAFGGLIGFLTVTEFKPQPVEPASPLSSSASGAIPAGLSLDVLSWNIGYAGLGAESDFFINPNISASCIAVSNLLYGIFSPANNNLDISLLRSG